MSRNIFFSPFFEMTVNNAIFVNQDLIVYPYGTCLPENIQNVVRFLFGEGAKIEQGLVYTRDALKVTGASYVLRDARTHSVDFTLRELKEGAGSITREQRLQGCKNFNTAIEELSKHLNQKQVHLDKAIGIIRLILREAYGEGWDNSLAEIKELAEKFLKEISE